MTEKQQGGSSPETIAATYGVAKDLAFGAVSPPMYLSSTYAFEGYEKPRAYDYGRSGNPSRDMLAEALAKLEGGAGAVITSSGMSAIDLLLGQLRPTDVVVAPHDCYSGTYRLLKARSERGQFSAKFVEQSNDQVLGEVLEAGAALVFVETPSNPLMRVVDIAKIAGMVKGVGAVLAVDNTFLSPALQQPIALGADYALHSTTKFLNGHSDVIGGAVVAADADRAEQLRDWSKIVGSSGSPFDAWLTLRGLRTLFARMERQQKTAAVLADWLQKHSAVNAVHYPGLASHPDHSIAAKQQSGYGAMLSFSLSGGAEAVPPFLHALRVFTLAESLGGVESLVAHPTTMTHADMGEEARHVAGIGDDLIRISVGLESPQDLLADLDEALGAV